MSVRMLPRPSSMAGSSTHTHTHRQLWASAKKCCLLFRANMLRAAHAQQTKLCKRMLWSTRQRRGSESTVSDAQTHTHTHTQSCKSISWQKFAVNICALALNGKCSNKLQCFFFYFGAYKYRSMRILLSGTMQTNLNAEVH